MTDEWDLVGHLVMFLDRYHSDDLSELASLGAIDDTVTEATFELSLLAMDAYNHESLEGHSLLEILIYEPDNTLALIEEIIEEYPKFAEDIRFDKHLDHSPNMVSFDTPDQVNVELVDPPKRIYKDIGEPRSDYFGQLVAFEGVCQQISDPKPRVIEAAFQCQRCETTISGLDASHTFDLSGLLPAQCGGCETQGPFKPHPRLEVREEYQQLRVQERPESAHNAANPRELVIDSFGNAMMDKCTAGDRITVVGVLREDRNNESTVVDSRLDAKAIISEETAFEDLEIKPEEKEKIQELAKEPQLFQYLRNTIAPSIYGNENEKMAVALQMFGGVTTEAYGNRKRGQIHILFMGDPGVGKSQIINSAHNLAPRSVSSSGTAASRVGLTATAVKESIAGEEQWTLQAGSLVLADGGLLTIDELDKMRYEDQQALTSALSDGTIDVDKANVHATLNARCSALVAANPVEGRFNAHDSLVDQFDMPKELLNRFDLVFTFRDTPEEELDAQIAGAVLDTHTDSGPVATADGGAIEVIDENGVVDDAIFRKYVAFARREYRPTLTEAASEKLKDWYVSIRGLSKPEDNQIAANARGLDGARRLSQAFARARLSETVELEHVDRAIELIMESKEQTQLDPDGNGYDVDRVEMGSETPAEKQRKTTVCEIIEELSGESPAPIQDVIDGAKDAGIGHDKAMHIIKKLKDKGEAYEERSDHIRLS